MFCKCSGHMRRQRVAMCLSPILIDDTLLELESVWDMNVHVSVFSFTVTFGIQSKISTASVSKDCENADSRDVIKARIGMRHHEETGKFIVDAMIWDTQRFPPYVLIRL
jgi:hypothetical protein